MWREQKLIRRAELEVTVDSVDEAMEELRSIADGHDGLVADAEDVQDQDGNRRATVRLRVPSASFESAVRAVRELGEVERAKLTTEDVTKAYADLELRLSAKRKTEERLRGLLASSTGDLSDVIQVERELSRIIGEIEQMHGERRFYDHRVAVSVIEVDLFEPGAGKGPGILKPVGDALKASLSVLVSSLAALVYIVALVTPWALAAALIWWSVSRVKRERAVDASSGDD